MINQLKYLTIGFFLLMAFSVLSGIIENLFFPNNLYAYLAQMSQRFEKNLWLLLFPLVIAPIFEEWLFRGIILSKLNKKFPFAISNIICASLFAVAHLDWFILPYFLNGLVYGWVMKKNDNLYSVIILHVMYNLIAILTVINIR